MKYGVLSKLNVTHIVVYIIVVIGALIPRSNRKPFSQTTSHVVVAATLYLTSVLESAETGRFMLLHTTAP